MNDKFSNAAFLTKSFVFILCFCLGLALWLGKDLFYGECSAHSSHEHHVWNTLGVDACNVEAEKCHH